MSESVPKTINGASILLYTSLDARHRPTGGCQHIVGGVRPTAISGLAICGDETNGFFLYYCDAGWGQITDTFHLTRDDAKQQAEFEYEGVSRTWQRYSDEQPGNDRC